MQAYPRFSFASVRQGWMDLSCRRCALMCLAVSGLSVLVAGVASLFVPIGFTLYRSDPGTYLGVRLENGGVVLLVYTVSAGWHC